MKFIVSYKNKTYDLKNFVDNHPGGSIIQFAENREVDKLLPYYHSNMESIERILEKYQIDDESEKTVFVNDKYEHIRTRIWNKVKTYNGIVKTAETWMYRFVMVSIALSYGILLMYPCNIFSIILHSLFSVLYGVPIIQLCDMIDTK